MNKEGERKYRDERQKYREKNSDNRVRKIKELGETERERNKKAGEKHWDYIGENWYQTKNSPILNYRRNKF